MNSTGDISFAISPIALDMASVKEATHRFSVFARFYSGDKWISFRICIMANVYIQTTDLPIHSPPFQ